MKKIVTFILTILFISVTFAEAHPWLTFDTREDLKAKGLWLTVKYPAGWYALPGDRPNIIRKFVSEVSGLPIARILMLQAVSLPDGTTLEADTWTDEEWTSMIEDGLPSSARLRSVKKIRHEAQNGTMSWYMMIGQRAGVNLYTENETMMIFYNDTAISLMCMTGGLLQDKKNIIELHKNETHQICQEYFNSLILMDQY